MGWQVSGFGPATLPSARQRLGWLGYVQRSATTLLLTGSRVVQSRAGLLHHREPQHDHRSGLGPNRLGVAKNTRFAKDERFNLQFRREAFNLFDRANFNQPAVVVNVSSPRFGSITSAGRREKCSSG